MPVEPENLEVMMLSEMTTRAEALTLEANGPLVTYSRKVFIPLTRLCRDVCHYCTFATTPSALEEPFLTLDEVVEIARKGQRAGCREALFTLGDQPEARYRAAREALRRMGYESTLDYLRAAAHAVLEKTTLLPHLNPGIMTADDFIMLRPEAVSMGIMLENISPRLCLPGGPHHGSPDKVPERRLAALEAAGEAQVPMTTGLLIGIGETRAERIGSLLAIRDLHHRYGHIQEVIIQNFKAKGETRMAHAPEPSLEEHLWSVAAARLILGADMVIQAPPNLHQPHELEALLRAGVNDWGGISPVTQDHVNPEAPWPNVDQLAAVTSAAGRRLEERLAIGPRYAVNGREWLDPALQQRVMRMIDGRGLPKADSWAAGRNDPLPSLSTSLEVAPSATVLTILARAQDGEVLKESEISQLFCADGADLDAVIACADGMRAQIVGDDVTYVVNRNINYTNICGYRCGFCAFSKGSTKSERGPAYLMDLADIGQRAADAFDKGTKEVCLQGGIHPDFDGRFYLAVLAAVRSAAPGIHIHAFSPLEVSHGARTLNMPLDDYLAELRSAGLSSLPGTAAEILDDEVRAILCPDKLSSDEWLEVMRTAHGVGLRSTATIMFGHVDQYHHWARHLLKIRALQEETGGFTEFVPLPFVHMEAPIWRKAPARSGPSHREAVLMHAIARIVLAPIIPNIQASWVKMGPEGASRLLNAGVNDLGGVLMNESITRAAGGIHGQMLNASRMVELAASVGRPARERSTFYEEAGAGLTLAVF